jgi:putative endonuclease
MSWYLYILRCNDESLYTGITWNLQKRIKEHNGRVKTSLQNSKLPVRLVYWERFVDRYKAAKREKEIKGWTRVKKQKLVNSLH